VFDRYTAELIASVPRLHGADPSELPKTLTEAYVRVAIARSTLQDRPDDLSALTAQALWADLDSLAAAYETIVLSDGDIGDGVMAATAFVAATAHHGLFLARRWVEQRDITSGLDGQSIPPEVSATLLYLIADANADAAEMASKIVITEQISGPDRHLLEAIRYLGRSEFFLLASLPLASPSGGGPVGQIGASMMSMLLLDALVQLSGRMLVKSSTGWDQDHFGKLAVLGSAAFQIENEMGDTRAAFSLFPGACHIARLMALVEPVLQVSAIVNLPAPSAIESEPWSRLTERIAKRRPVLWRNHLDAIRQGLLERGISAAVTFPTGAGKSTVSELKIGAALLSDGDVIFLVPTLALMDQTARALQNVFPEYSVIAQREDEDGRLLTASSPKVIVMTPESCLATLNVRPDFVSDLSLVVFDEAHLLDAGEGVPDQRSLDAMLCLLSLMEANPEADVMLVSAMVRNARELAAWLESSTGRMALGLNMDWKPTRQARAAVLYKSEEVRALTELLDSSFADSPNLFTPSAVKKQLFATPFGFFSLRHSWESRKFVDYLLVPLLSERVLLSASGRRPNSWYLAPNSNAVAAAIAAASASSGLKVLVFAQSVGWAVSIANQVSTILGGSVQLNPPERKLMDRIVEELGDSNALYLDTQEAGLVGPVCVHHGLLLPAERRLHEMLYLRSSGVSVMVATSTIAQGMNLPSEVVIIAGDARFDSESDRMARLKPHEILNAAGRAGRAGHHANGLVLVVPSSVIDLDATSGHMHAAWDSLQSIFSQGDQCVDIRDPLESVLDSLESANPGPLGDYFLRRIGARGAGQVTPEQLLSGSLAAFRASSRGETHWVSDRLAVVESATTAVDAPEWQIQLCAATGVSVASIQLFDSALADAPRHDGTISEWTAWFFGVLRTSPVTLQEVLRGGSRALFKGADDSLGEWEIEPTRIVNLIEEHLGLWMRGATLADIEELAKRSRLTKGSPQLTAARKFVLRVIPDLVYLFALPSHILKTRQDEEDSGPISLAVDSLADCVRVGVDSLEKLRMLHSDVLMTRVRVHRSAAGQ
jgi:hypothetical protein